MPSDIPTAAELISLALDKTDFLGDLSDDVELIDDNASNSVLTASDIWGDDNPLAPPVPLDVINRAVRALVLYGERVLAEREQAIADALADGIAAGDLDRNGDWIEYDRYPG